jgi:2,3-bisphosphoglycerate-dependent phosphoglycerate mutase
VRPTRAPLALALLALFASVAHAGPRVAKKPRGTLVLVRHGESQANVDHIMAGKLNPPLTALGRQQAAAVGKKLRRFRFDRAYSSTRSRAKETLAIALDAAGQSQLVAARRSGLDERAFGILEGVTHEQAAARYGAANLRTWRLSWTDGPPGGESMEQLSRRVVRLYRREILPRLEAGENIVVTSHKHTLRALIAHLDGLNQAELAALEVSNADPIVYRLGQDGAARRLKPRARAKKKP